MWALNEALEQGRSFFVNIYKNGILVYHSSGIPLTTPLIRFLKQRKKGSYSVLVQAYSELIASMPIVMALEIIQEDLQKQSEERIELNYFSLARAVARFKKKNPQVTQPKHFQFKDAHEISNVQLGPGRFKIK